MVIAYSFVIIVPQHAAFTYSSILSRNADIQRWVFTSKEGTTPLAMSHFSNSDPVV